MFTFEQQQKILKPILANNSNKQCADCNSINPTWASLDFGVFVCSNCSGAHRALGPTITRIKSINLDQWQKIWVENMRIGNVQVNLYWQADKQGANFKRPKMGAKLEEHNRFITEKYVRKKFVRNQNEIDPLTSYKKNGTYSSSKANQSVSSLQVSPSDTQKNPIVLETPIINMEKKTKSATYNLLDDSDNEEVNTASNNKNQALSNVQEPDDQFSDFVEVPQAPVNQKSSQNTMMTFEELMKAPQLGSHNSQPPPQHHNQNAFNLHDMYAEHSQVKYNNYHHNPYVGYVPHYNGHQSMMHGTQNMHPNHHFNSAPHNNNGNHQMSPQNNIPVNPNFGFQSIQSQYERGNGIQGFNFNNRQ